MKAVVVESVGRLAVIELPRPVPLANEVIVHVAACGICGSDIRYLHGHNPWAAQTLGRESPNPPNMALGHEFAGTVVEAGSGVSQKRLGERVGVLAYRGCGRCHYCRAGRHNLCGEVEHIGHSAGWATDEINPAGMAEYCRVWADMAFQLPAETSFDQACLLDGLAVAIHACEQGRVGRGDHIAIIGAGAVGLLILQVARLGGAASLVCFDTCRKPLDVATQLGADQCQQVGRDADDGPWFDRFDAVFDTVGSTATLSRALSMLRRGGRAVLMAHPSGAVAIDTRLFSGERALLTSANNAYADFPMAIELVAAGRVRLDPLITHSFPIAQAAEAFATAEAKEKSGAIKVLIRPGAGFGQA